MKGICRICGNEYDGESFDEWVRDTFTNYDNLHPGDVICDNCLFWFEQKSVELQLRMGKDKPQKMQNYCHFLLGGEWYPVGKGDKRKMTEILLSGPFPELAAIAVSGQKHIAFRARHNNPGQSAGWVQFEEQRVWVEQEQLANILSWVEELYTTFAKSEIESGRYSPRRIMAFGIDRWEALENQIKLIRQTTNFQLALFLAQRSENGNEQQGDDGDAAQDHLEGDTKGLQEPLQDDDLGAVRERDQKRSLHRKPGEVHQLNLFAIAGGHR